jgi:hypothetical protein
VTLILAEADPTRLTVALPFAIGAILLLVGSIVAIFVEKRVRKTFGTFAAADRTDTQTAISYSPDTLAASVGWTTDAAQIIALVLTPLLGLLLLKPSISGSLGLLYIAAFLVALAAEYHFLRKVRVDTYASKSKWIFSPVTIIGIILNLIAGGVAFALGP